MIRISLSNAVAVDIYGKWVHVQEYKAPNTVDSEKAEAD